MLLERYASSAASQCTYVAIDQFLPWQEGTLDFEDDGLHLSREGYSNFAKALAKKILALVRLEVGPTTE